MPTPAETLHERLKGFLLFLKPALLGGGVDQDRLSQLRRLSDVRIRKFAVEKPQMTGLDLCALLADPRTGRFDALAIEAGLLTRAQLASGLPLLAEDMGYLVEACLTQQVAGAAAMKGHARAFVEKHGSVAEPAAAAPAAAAKAAVAPLPPAVAKRLAPIKDLWTLAPATLKALGLLAAPDSAPDAVCVELERDPELAARLLRFANVASAEKSSSLRKAVVALGYPAARRLALAAALSIRLGPPYAEAGFDAKAHWTRSLRIAHAAAQVATATRLGNPDDHFFAGLLHDAGRLAEAKAGGPAPDAPSPQIGAEILGRWRFAPAVVAAARHHSDTAEQLEEIQLPREALVVVALRHWAPDADLRTWAGYLRIAADSVGPLLDQAARQALVDAAELAS